MNDLTIKIFMSKYNWNISMQEIGTLIQQDIERLGITAAIDDGGFKYNKPGGSDGSFLHNVTFNSQEDLNLYKVTGQIRALNDNYETPIYEFIGDRECK